MKVGVEIGGTFTDLIAVLDEGTIKTLKVLSTPSHPEKGALKALVELGVPFKDMNIIVHGSTIATNAVLERKGAQTILITTKGFRDILEIQNHDKSEVYNMYYQKPVPLVARDRVIEVDERLDSDGAISKTLDVQEILTMLGKVIGRENGTIESIVICFLHSYKNPIHENKVRKIIEKKFPNIFVTPSSEVLPEYREYGRASTTVMSAYLRPVVGNYMTILKSSLQTDGFLGDIDIMQSNGGIFPCEVAERQAVNIILSGPAAGVTGAAYVAKATGLNNIMTLDMGGTSTDVCLIKNGQPTISTDNQLDGLPIKIPMIDIVTVGAGGGSIAWRDPGGMLRVGPQSAGADPGPACYNRGGKNPTVTDAYLLLGLIRPNKFFGGKIYLNWDAARESIAKLGYELHLNEMELAEGIYKVANSNMVQAMRLVSIERGYDPRDYTLVAFGGAGALHAAALAEELNMEGVLIPQYTGLLSALGLQIADFRRDFVQTNISKSEEITLHKVLIAFDRLREKTVKEFNEYHLDCNSLLYTHSIDLRYLGQAHYINVPVELDKVKSKGKKYIVEEFHKLYDQRYGHHFSENQVQFVNFRLTVSSKAIPLSWEQPQDTKDARWEHGQIFTNGSFMKCRFYWRDSLPIGFELEGPSIIEEKTATCYIPTGWKGKIDKYGSIVMKRNTIKTTTKSHF